PLSERVLHVALPGREVGGAVGRDAGSVIASGAGDNGDPSRVTRRPRSAPPAAATVAATAAAAEAAAPAVETAAPAVEAGAAAAAAGDRRPVEAARRARSRRPVEARARRPAEGLGALRGEVLPPLHRTVHSLVALRGVAAEVAAGAVLQRLLRARTLPGVV